MMVGSVVVPVLVSLAVMGVSGSSDTPPSCPLPGDILPCLCFNDDPYGLVMDCSGVIDEPQLAKIFTVHFPTIDFYELRIFHDPMDLDYRLHSLEKSTFGETTFQRVNITGTQIIVIDGYAFDKSKATLKLLTLESNRINEFSFGSLARYTSLTALFLAHNNLHVIQQIHSPVLEVLDLSGNKALVIEQNTFAGTPSLQQLILSHTNQEKVERGLFTTLGHLNTLDLSDNNLKTVEDATIVTPNASLTLLDLSNNEITFVRHDAIVGLASNATLSLAENKITLLTQTHWQHVFDQLKPPFGLINMADNPLVCGCDMDWIVLNEAYLHRFTDTTTCQNGERVIFLDPNIFAIMCSRGA